MFLPIILGVSKWMKWQNTVADPGEGPRGEEIVAIIFYCIWKYQKLSTEPTVNNSG